MKTGVQSVTIKLIDTEVRESLVDLIENPGVFHGISIEDEEEAEVEVSGKKYAIVDLEGTGQIGPWTRIIFKIDASETPVDMVIALDTSYSMISSFEDSTRFDLAVDGIIDLIGEKSKHLIVGVLAYGVNWEMSMDLTNAQTFTKKKLSDLRKDLIGIKHKGKAAAGTALNGATEVFSIKGVNDVKAVVLLSDGADEIGPNPLTEAGKLVTRGIYIYPFYLGEETDQKSLTIFERIAEKSHTRLFSLHDAADQEKRRLIRASLMEAESEEMEDGIVSDSVPSEETGGDIEAGEPDGTIPVEGDSEQENATSEGKDDIQIPTASELLLRELRELGLGLPFIIQEGGAAIPSDEDPDTQVIRAGIPVEEEDVPDSKVLTFSRTPKIVDAIKNFIEWVKGLIW